MLKKIILLLIIVQYDTLLFSEIAIFPYRVNNPSVYFKNELGVEYSKLLAVGAVYRKELDVLSPRDLEMDLNKFGINAENSITDEDLNMLGRARYLDLILLGSLSKTGSKYKSSSLLYSVKDNRVLFRINVSANSIINLAEKEINEAFIQYGRRKQEGSKLPVDIVFLLDTSYKMSYDWAGVKESIVHAAGTLVDTLRVNSRIYIVPFSSKTSHDYGTVAANSITLIRKALNDYKPSGGFSAENFFHSLRYAVESIKWRNNARKLIVILTNSNIGRYGFNEKYGIIAGKKGIKINSVALGSLKGDDSEIVRRLSTITGGLYRDVSYHQKAFDVNGGSLELYLESSRFFQSRIYDISWLEGIILKENNQSGFGRPRSYLDEILYDEKRFNIEPYSMPELFTGITGERIINKGPIENNINEILNLIFNANYVKSGSTAIPVGKALLSDGKISVWVQIGDRGMFDYLNDKSRQSYLFPLGISISDDPVSTYGISFSPVVYKIGADFIPEIIKADLSDIIKRKQYYLGNGFFHPPLWFVDVKVEGIELLNKVKDIREE